MLPSEQLSQSNFVDGIKFNPEQIQVSSDYLNQRLSLNSIYGIGQGILVGFLDSMQLVVIENQLILKRGAAIDENGNSIFVDQEYVVLEDITTSKYENRTTNYVYAMHESKMDNLDSSRHDKDVKLYYTIKESFAVVVSEKIMRNQPVIEIGRFHINKKHSDKLRNPINPFEVEDNEINYKFVPKIVGNNIAISTEDRFLVANTLMKYGEFLHEFGFRKAIHSMATIASFALNIASDVKNRPNLAIWQLYDMLKDLLALSLKVEVEREDIQNTAFWKNMVRLESIFAFKESLRVDYYHLFINIDNSFFSKVLLHFNNATIFDGNWETILQEKKEEKVTKDYLIVGSDASCDMVVEGEDIAAKHAKIYKYQTGYFIEDLDDTSGVYVNAERIDRGVKKFIRKQDYVVLGKNGRVINLQNIQL